MYCTVELPGASLAYVEVSLIFADGRREERTEERKNGNKCSFMYIDDKYIMEKIINLWKDWKAMERTSKREDRCTKPSFPKQQDSFLQNILDLPFNILCRDYENILKTESGIKDWREDLQNLHKQLQREQVGTCDGYDAKQ